VRVVIILGIVLGLATPVRAQPEPPCKGCLLDVPASVKTPMPLLVVLHGDRETARAAHARWRAAAKKRKWVLLSLDCPVDDGCTNKEHSWWQWGGEPQWILDRVVQVVGEHSIDPARMYLAGWSGGATYLGMRSIAWPDTFAAIVIHGGGQPPWDETACPHEPLPAYFFVGDKNPLHHLAQGLRAYLDACKQEVTWDVIRGAAHAREHSALDAKKGVAILDWLDKHARTRDVTGR
jgi:poly(3-hydroxybutyrate) depolymerase